jgi:class 3 adenylate cyclase/tetratricopeptide (TPR) repeat protein
VNVEAWLTELGLEQYVEAFAENGVDLSLLPELTNEDLKDLGVDRLVDRKTIFKAIARLSESEDEPTGEPPAPTTIAGERRQVTVLFADLAGFTKLSGELGAEATHALLNRYFEAVDAIVEGYGGSIDKHIGDNVMALFGAPVAHSDDPERALRAALDIHRTMADLSAEFGRPLQAHIGIERGSEAHREYTVTGSSVNLASRLQDQAEAGATLLSQAVQRATSELAESAPMGEIEVKGFAAPVPVWRLEGLRRDTAAAQRSPFVGRRAERRQFDALIEECLEAGTGQAVLARGEAGIGKTRLVEEFAALAEAEGFATHKGLILDFGVGKGRDAIRALVRSLLGLAEGGAKAARAAAADRAVEMGWLDPDARVFLNDLLDLPQPLKLRALYDAMDNATRSGGKQAAVANLIRGSSGAQPILVAVEDVHWADGLTLAHLAEIASTVADCPAVLVMTSRVEGDPLDQAWRASLRGSPLTTMDLQPLRAAEAEELARGFVETTSAFVQDCIARAEGNPLFLEQLLRNAEEGALTEVPGSIQSLILARMDRLEPRDKQALQAASVIGQRFAPDALRALMEDAIYDCRALVEQYLIRPEGSDYLFAHALIQEGVYSSLLQDRKRELHRRAANWFARSDPGLKAEHLDRADDPGAPRAYFDAARVQSESYRYERALTSLGRGLELANEPGDSFALTCMKAQILHDLGSTPQSIEASKDALELATDGTERCRAWLCLAAGMRVSGDFEDGLAALDKAEPLAVEHGLRLELARLHHTRGNIYFPLGRIEGCLAEHEMSLRYAREAGSPEAEAQALSGLGDAEYARGRMISAHDYFRRCVTLCREHGLGRIEVANLPMAAVTRMYLLEIPESFEDGLASAEAAQRVGHLRAEVNALSCMFNVIFDLGEIDCAPENLERQRQLIQRLGARAWECPNLFYHGQFLTVTGRRQEGLELMERALKVGRETAPTFFVPRVLGKVALNTNDPAVRQNSLEEAVAILRAGSVGHNHLWFRRDAIEVALRIRDWDGVERHAKALEDYTRPEPLPWSDFFIAWGRALAAWGRGRREPELVAELQRLRNEAERSSLTTVLPTMDEVLKTA